MNEAIVEMACRVLACQRVSARRSWHAWRGSPALKLRAGGMAGGRCGVGGHCVGPPAVLNATGAVRGYRGPTACTPHGVRYLSSTPTTYAGAGGGGAVPEGAEDRVSLPIDYTWLEDTRSEAVRALVDRENVLAKEALQETTAFQEALTKEMKARYSAQTEDHIPVAMSGYEYFERTPIDKEHGLLCRRRVGSGKGTDAEGTEVLLDVNSLAAGTGYAEVALDIYSHDGKTMAYMVDTSGTEAWDLYVKDLETGRSHHVAGNADGAVFINPDEPQGLLYLTRDAAKQVTLWHCAFEEGRKPGRRNRLWSLRDATCDVYLEPIGEGYWAKLSCEWLRRSQLYVVDTSPLPEQEDAGKPWANLSRHRPIMIHPNDPTASLDVEARGDWLYALSTKPPYQLSRFDPRNMSDDNWERVIAERPGVELVRASMTKDFCVLGVKTEGVFFLEVYPWTWLDALSAETAGSVTGVAPELEARPWQVEGTALRDGTSLEPYSVRLFDSAMDVETIDPRAMPAESNEVRFYVNSPCAREAAFSFDLATATTKRLTREPKWQRWPWSMFEMQYETYKMVAPADDGATIPMTVVHKAGLKHNRSNPCLMMVYGAYGVDLNTSFDVPILSLIRRGWVIAFAHVRGGGEKGDAWHEAGRGINKMNTFTDFVRCAGVMSASGLTQPSNMAAYAGSAGGTVLGYVANEHPELFKALVLESPFLDVETALRDKRNEFASEDHMEWGDPSDPDVQAAIAKYDPVPNVRPQDYPWMLCVASWSDSRVPFWHSAKFVAKVLDERTNEAPMLLKVREGSHAGGSHRSFAIEQSSFVYAFLVSALNLDFK